MQGRWLTIVARIQDALLFIWLAHVSFIPQQFSSLANIVGLAALWACMLLMGGWHLVKDPAQRGLAVWVMVAFPLAFLLVTVLGSTIDMPMVEPPAGRWLFFGAVSLLPLYGLTRWLLKTTRPQPDDPVRMRITTTILLIVVFTQMCVSLLLVWALASGNDFQSFRNVFGHDWFTNLLNSALVITLLLAIGGIPYAILGIVRRSGHRGAMLGILLCIGVSVACVFGVFGFIAMMSFG